MLQKELVFGGGALGSKLEMSCPSEPSVPMPPPRRIDEVEHVVALRSQRRRPDLLDHNFGFGRRGLASGLQLPVGDPDRLGTGIAVRTVRTVRRIDFFDVFFGRVFGQSRAKTVRTTVRA